MPLACALPVTIAAADGHQRQLEMRVVVNPPPVINEEQPIDGMQGQALNRPLKVEGGTPPYRWKISEGTLPAGIRLDPDGALRGAPSHPGDAEVTVTLDDRWLASTQQKVKIHVKPNENPPPEQKDQQQQQDQKQQQDQQDKAKDQQQNGQQPQPKPGEQKDGDKDQKDQQKKDDAAQRSEQLNRAATDRWLDQLPKENKDVLRYQLLDGGERKPEKKGKTW